jgi:cytochrome c oxidase subunit IV
MANSQSHTHEHHITSPWVYIKTLIALLILMAATVAVSYVKLDAIGPFSGTVVNQTVALIIAVIKAALVILYFMGVKDSTPLTKLWAITGFVVFFLMFIIFGDYAMRRFEPVPNYDIMGESGYPHDYMPGSEARPSNNWNLRPRG